MFDYIYLGSAPGDEECAQVGKANYHIKARNECIVCRKQFLRLLQQENKLDQYQKLNEENQIALSIKSSPHDFGSYLELVIKYNVDNAEAVDLALLIDSMSPGNWDAEAIQELEKNGE